MKKILTTILILVNLMFPPTLALANEPSPETQETILIPETLEYANLEPKLLYLLTPETEINQETEIPILDSILDVEENPQAILKYNNSYFIYDKKGRLTNVKTYNTDGTIKQDETRIYTGDDRLKTLENKDIKATYFYDELGNKMYQSSITKATNVKEDVFYFNDNYRIYGDREEIDIIVAGKRFATVQVFNNNTENVIYYVNDPVGSSSLAYNELGVLQEQTDTLPYGDKRFAIDSKNVTSKFALHDRNENTNQAYMKARNYDFSNKHFQTQDSISKYNPASYVADPQQLNMYSYARNNPVMYNDPTGNCVGVAAGLDTLACAVVAEATLSWLAAAGTAALATGGAYWYSTTKNSADTQKGDAVATATSAISVTSNAGSSSPNDYKEKKDKDNKPNTENDKETPKKVHGNSNEHEGGTSLYQLRNRITGQIEKWGITNKVDAVKRYTQNFYEKTNTRMVEIERFVKRIDARIRETKEIKDFTKVEGRRPSLNKTNR